MRTAALVSMLALCLVAIGCGVPGRVSRDISPGERLFRANCRACHVLPKPRKHTDEEWVKLVPRYANPDRLPPADQQKIIEYLQENN